MGAQPLETVESTHAHQKSRGLRRVGLELVAISFVVLFQELALIRWLPAQVRVVAYFPNLVLISAFLGLGLGSLRSRGRSLVWLWPLALGLVVGGAWALSHVAFTARGVSQHLWLLYYDLPEDGWVYEGVRLPLVALFVLCALSFVPLGQAIGQRLNRFHERSSALWGYAFDLGGSLLGVIGFAVASFMQLFPVVWFAVVFLAAALWFLADRRRWPLWVAGGAIVLAAVGLSEKALHYSPYYAISLDSDPSGNRFAVLTNGSLHQVARSVHRGDRLIYEDDQRVRAGYHLPFEEVDRRFERALVLGAGTGNDVAVLLDQGVASIDAVEIDPVIAQLGRELHPNDPYGSPRVTVHSMDARTFLNNTDETYDLIVFGTLDSMTRTSALGNVRLDNFVYTREALTAARERLRPDGGLAMYFMVGEEYINHRLAGLIASVFGEPPVTIKGGFAVFNHVYLAGPAFASLRRMTPENAERYMAEFLPTLDLPTDDWPYLYLMTRGVSGFYLSLMVIFLALAALGVFSVSKEMRASLGAGRGLDVEMFLFGAAFLLLETHFVTAMSLVWGVTWLTSAVVFASILLVILAATVAVELRPMPWRVAATGLVVTLVAGYLIPPEALLLKEGALRLAASVLYVGAPVFFAGVCFALRFRVRTNVDVAFGWNVLGAVAGGLLEFLSMAVGLSAMALIAAAAYLAAFLMRERAEAAGTPGAPSERRVEPRTSAPAAAAPVRVRERVNA